METLSEAEWPAWTSGSSELHIDGLSVTRVLSNVHIQLETLRNRKFLTKSGTTLENELSILSEKISIVEKSGIEKIPDMERMMEVMKKRIDSTADSNASNLASLEMRLSGRIEGLERRIDAIEISLGGVEVVVSGLEGEGEVDTSIRKRLETLESKLMSLSDSSPSLESNYQKMVNQLYDMKKQLDILPKKITEISDSCSINDCKIKDLVILFSNVDTGYNRIKNMMETLPADCYAKIKDEITDLYDKKADRSELSKKADVVQLHLKADLNEVSVLNDLSNQLDRKIEANKLEVNDSLNTLHSNYDKRLESLLQWILKQLKRLAGNMNNDTGMTDIGKVKCLVCDHVVNQLVSTDIVFGGPALPVSLKTLTLTRPLAFENDADRERSQRPKSAVPQAWTHGSNTFNQNRSSSSSHTSVLNTSTKSLSNRLSPQNLEIFNANMELEQIFQNPHETPSRVRPSTSSCARGEAERSGMFNRSAATSTSQIGDGPMTTGEQILSQFRELEL
jgi:hypothetical protein